MSTPKAWSHRWQGWGKGFRLRSSLTGHWEGRQTRSYLAISLGCIGYWSFGTLQVQGDHHLKMRLFWRFNDGLMGLLLVSRSTVLTWFKFLIEVYFLSNNFFISRGAVYYFTAVCSVDFLSSTTVLIVFQFACSYISLFPTFGAVPVCMPS